MNCYINWLEGELRQEENHILNYIYLINWVSKRKLAGMRSITG